MILYKRFRKELKLFLEDAKVNLGRKTCKPRKVFIDEVMARVDEFYKLYIEDKSSKHSKETDQSGLRPNAVIVLKPTCFDRALNIGKGVTAMSASESSRADEQLNRSPFVGNTKEKEK